jgi:glucose/arabinose dehydrogenase|tara:strand:+ start:1536 stop:2936 length:1401 start_codon:yes stop_codon:yes gene_type:complete
MKNIPTLFAAILLFVSSSSQAQTQWDIEGTLLNEYDLVTGLQIPWEILWGPDDMLWATTRPGDVLRIDPETGSYTNVLNIDVFGGNGAEPGLLGMAMHPDWENTPKVFLVYCTGSSWSNASENLSVFDFDGENLVNEEILLTVDAGGIHNGSRLLILPDNTLLMSTGDTGDGGNSSQNQSHLNGKMLRLNLDGSIPSDNPWPGSYVYSWGHRNSQGLCLGPDGIIYSSEHGQSNWDEFNIIEPGRNYGWPNVEGLCNGTSELAFCEENNVREPLRAWAPCIAVNGIEYYNHPAIPAWNHTVLLSVLGGLGGQYERLSVLHLSADGLEVESEDQYFSEFNQRVRDIAINPNTGAIYMALNGPSYPGYGPNIIKEFRPDEYDSVDLIKEELIDALIYPVPALENINIDISDALIGGHYNIIDYHGKIVMEGGLNSNTQVIQVNSLARGSYYLFLQNGDNMITRTFTLQ